MLRAIVISNLVRSLEIANSLDTKQFQFNLVETAESAIILLRSNSMILEKHSQIAIYDMSTPGKIERFAREIKECQRNIKVIAFGAEDLPKGKPRGADEYLREPFSAEQLRSTISRLVFKSR